MKVPISQYSGTEVAYNSQASAVANEGTDQVMSLLYESIRKPAKPSIHPQSLDPDEAAAQCLQNLTDPNSVLLPAEALRVLVGRNQALLTEPRGVILAALGRQSILLEAASTRFLSRAALEKSEDTARILSVMGLRCSAALHKVLGALHEVTDGDTGGITEFRRSVIPQEVSHD